MEQVCFDFHHYDFLGDANFTAGWCQISNSIPELEREQEFLKAKLFYYTRCFNSITAEEYVTWLTKQSDISQVHAAVVDYSHPLIYDSQKQLYVTNGSLADNLDGMEMESLHECEEGLSKLNLEGGHVDKEISDFANVNSSPKNNVSCPAKMEKNADPSDISEDSSEPKYPTSFYDLMWMIEKGEKIPGVDDLDIEPTNENPTSSQKIPVRKPWEN